MKSRKILIIFMLICIVLSLTSCDSTQVNKDLIIYNPNLYKDMKLTIENHINYLTSKDCDGRLLGTDGNIKAQNYIRYCLEQYNIAPYTDLYNSQFSYNCTDITKTIVKVNGKKLKENIDFQIQNVSNKMNVYKISDTLSTNNDSKIVMFEKASLYDITQYANEHSFEVVLKKSNGFINIVENKNIKENWLIINLSPDIYDSLNNNDKVEIECVYENKNKTDNNIVGIIKSSQETKNAIILSAHFDHMGSLNGDIYSGAIDNASGCAGLLDIARNLSSTIDTSKLNCDIIFAFFNAEEDGKVGSSEFNKQLSAKYQNIIDINIDCIGGKGHDGVWMDLTNYNIQAIHDKISSQFDIVKVETMSSDHNSFENAIGISTYDSSNENLAFDIIHTPLDTPDKLDIDNLQTFSNRLDTIINDLAIDEHTFCNVEDSTDNILTVESNKLEFGQYKYIKDTVFPVYNLLYSSDDMQIIKYFIDDYDKLIIKQVYIGFNRSILPNYDDSKEIDKIYTVDYDKLTTLDISSLYFNNYDNNNSMTIVISKFNKLNDPINVEYMQEQLQKLQSVEKNGVKYYSTTNPCDRIRYTIDDGVSIYDVSILLRQDNVELNCDDIYNFSIENQIFDLVNNVIDKIKD